MARMTPDPTFSPSPRSAMIAPPEALGYVVTIDPDGAKLDGLGVLDLDPESSGYGRVVGRLDMPNAGDELHHFGWNACSSALCPTAPHPHVERRYLLAPGRRSSRIHVIDTKPDPRQPRLVKTIEPGEVTRTSGYSRPHTSHCGPDGNYMSALGNPEGEGAGGVFTLDHDDVSVRGPWENKRGSQYLHYEFRWHLGHPFGAVPPLVSDINLSLDDRHLYVSCWGTGDLRQYDVSDPFNPRLTGTVRLGGIVSGGAHPKAGPLNGGPQMVEVSRDGRRVYVSNPLDASWDAQFYPEGIRGWIARLDANGGMTLDEKFPVQFEGERPHQIHLQGGDSTSDSYCFPS